MSVTVSSWVNYQILLLQKLTRSVCQICHLKDRKRGKYTIYATNILLVMTLNSIPFHFS